jgi:glycosyltransferase involved in cell wall biosynthesis
LFLGFIDRREQLLIMKGARAVVQPSLFEGWSTVVEDAKAMNQFVIASDLEVHKEQLQDYPANSLFAKSDYTSLAKKLEEQLINPTVKVVYNYRANILNFAQKFMTAIQSLSVRV